MKSAWGADEEEIRRAYERTKQVYAEDALAVYGLYAPDELREYREQVERAFRVLIDNENRRAYDRTLVTKPLPKNKRILVRAKNDASDEPTGGANAVATENAALKEWHDEADVESGDEASPSPAETVENVLPAAPQGASPVARSSTVPRRVELPEGAPITGPTLRALREEAGIRLAPDFGGDENLDL